MKSSCCYCPKCENKKVFAVIEMPMFTRYKYEIDKETGLLTLDRPINQKIPSNYGFIENTLAEDGDALDVFVMASESIPSTTLVELDVIGMVKVVDNGQRDDKILAYVKDDDAAKAILNPEEFLESVVGYLRTYKSGVVLEGNQGKTEAVDKINKTRRLALLASEKK